MISLTNKIPHTETLNAEALKIQCLFDSYCNDDRVMFWVQDNGKAYISMTDGNMIIYNRCADIDELRQFVDVLAPACIFSDYETLKALEHIPEEHINIMFRKADITGTARSDELSSKELYSILDTDGLSLPEYPYFAVDYCHRLNRGYADYFGIKDTCAVITFNSDNNAIINGLASHKKGYGTVALSGILIKNHGKNLLVCCRDKVKGFYEKNGFEFLYYAGYWVKNK